MARRSQGINSSVSCPAHLGISNLVYNMMRALNGREFNTRTFQIVICSYHQDVHSGYSIPRVAQIVAEVLTKGAAAGHFNKTTKQYKNVKHNMYSREPDYGEPMSIAERAAVLQGFFNMSILTPDILNTWIKAEK